MPDKQQINFELETLTDSTIKRIKSDYRKGTGLTLWDIARKYSISFSTACYIVKVRITDDV